MIIWMFLFVQLMPSEKQKDILEDFRDTLTKIDNLYHVKQFKNLSQSKIIHFKSDSKSQSNDFYLQMRRLFLHMIYLYYVAYIKKIDFYIYPHLCINRWGVIFRYYSLQQSSNKFMELVPHQDFKDNVRMLFISVWNIKKPEQQEMENKQEDQNTEKNGKENALNKQKSPWIQFADQFIKIFDPQKIEQLTPKDIIQKLQQTNQMKDNVLIVGVLSSTILSCLKLDTVLQKNFRQSYFAQPLIVNKMLTEAYENEGLKEFIDCIIRFFKILNDLKILGITTTISDKLGPVSEEGQNLLTEFRINLGRPLMQKQTSSQVQEFSDEKNPTSNKSSEKDYNQVNENFSLGQLKCQYFWIKSLKPRTLNFRVAITSNKKVYPLYFSHIEEYWHKLIASWKVISKEKSQTSDFNPNFVRLSYNKELYQISFCENIKCQPFNNPFAQLILTTDKLIICALAMREIICFYERKSISIEITGEEFIVNDGRLEDLALSISRCIRNYSNYSFQIISFLESNTKN